MSGVAQIYEGRTIEPTREEIAERFGAMIKLDGSYRLVDRDGEVGIDVLIGHDFDGRLTQMPLTYRDHEIDPLATLCTLEHSELGTRWVSNALADPVAVREMIRTIISGDDGAAFSDGRGPALTVVGSGTDPEASVEDVQLSESTRQRALGTVRINGDKRSFKLRMPNLLKHARVRATGYTTTKLHLLGVTPEGQELISAELFWRDGVSG